MKRRTSIPLDRRVAIDQGMTVLLLCSLALGQLGRISLDQQLAIYPHDAIVTAWSALLVLRLDSHLRVLKWLKRRRTPLTILFVCLIAGWLGAFSGGQDLTTPLLYTARLCAYLIWFGLLFSYSATIAPRLRWKLVLLGGLLAAWGIIQYVLLPDVRFLAALGWDDHYARLVGTQLDPGFTGMMLIICFIVSWFVETPTIHRKGTGLISSLLIGSQSLMIVALALTFSRASYVALFIGAAILVMQRSRRFFKLIALSSLLAVSILLAPKPTGEGVVLTRMSTVTSRISTNALWISQLTPLQWLVGRGAWVQPTTSSQGVLPDHANAADAVIVTVLSGVGGLGMVALCWLAYLSLQYVKADSLAWPVIASVLTHSFFNNTLLQPFVLVLMLLSIKAGVSSEK